MTIDPVKTLAGRVALITGAARGIGLATVKAMAAQGAHIVAFDVPDAALAEAAAYAREQGVRFGAWPGDVASADDWCALVAHIQAEFGRLDIVVNNAGISGRVGSLLDCQDEEFDRVMAVNARGVFLGLKHGAGAMKANNAGGAIVNVASVSGIGGGRYTIAYTASKHAVVGMTKVAAAELAPLRIRVNAVCPSPTATEMMFSMERERSPADDPDAVRRGMTRMIPMGRYGEPEEIAATVLYLASDAASFVTGVALPVDGGLKAA
jgi:NAD(P)-dependent dehydrogenase (short-subunit alcohol dehydrogenase family)